MKVLIAASASGEKQHYSVTYFFYESDFQFMLWIRILLFSFSLNIVAMLHFLKDQVHLDAIECEVFQLEHSIQYKKHCLDLHESWWKGVAWAKKEPIHFWSGSEST